VVLTRIIATTISMLVPVHPLELHTKAQQTSLSCLKWALVKHRSATVHKYTRKSSDMNGAVI
jgi:hypothetical protein